jgi:arylformamidase
MRIYDITLTISQGMVVWPGDPPVEIDRISEIGKGDTSNVTRLQMSAHTGTHIDAPFHFIEGGETVENIPIETLTGRVYVLHLPDAETITLDMVKDSPIPPRTKRVIFRTRNSEIWKSETKKFKQNFVSVSPEAAEYLVGRGVKLIGVDYLSVAAYDNGVPTHKILLEAGVVIVEGLDLSEVEQGRYTLYCLPLKIAGSDGAPARAILIGV